MKDLKDKKELVDLMTIALLHVTQGLEQGRLIANTLLSQTCFTYHWSEYCEIGLQGVHVAEGMDVPTYTQVFMWVCALSEQATQGFEFTPRTESANEAAKLRAFVINVCRAIKQAILRNGNLPEQTHANCMRLVQVDYVYLINNKVCGLMKDADATKARYYRRTAPMGLNMKVRAANPEWN